MRRRGRECWRDRQNEAVGSEGDGGEGGGLGEREGPIEGERLMCTFICKLVSIVGHR